MKKNVVAVTLVALTTVGIGACVPLKLGAPPCSPSPNLAAEVFEAVNRDRANSKYGAFAPVAWDQQLANQAQAWAENMAARGVVYHSTHGREHENVLGHWPCITNGADLEATWLVSLGHEWQILNPSHTRIGVGWVVTGSELWAVQQFG